MPLGLPDLPDYQQQFFTRLAKSESGGRNVRQQVNDTGTAFGPFQFTEGTWNGFIGQHPELGLTPADRFLPKAQYKAIVPFTIANADALSAALQRKARPREIVAAHRVGVNGAVRLANAAGNAKFGDILPDAAAANPSWANMSVASWLDDAARVAGDERMPSAQPDLPDNFNGHTIGDNFPNTNHDMERTVDSMPPQMREVLAMSFRNPATRNQALAHTISWLNGGGGPTFNDLTAVQKEATSLYGTLNSAEARDYIRRRTLPEPAEGKPPQMRTRVEGGDEVQEEYVGGRWVPVGRGPRWAPPAPQAPGESFVGSPGADAQGNLVIRDKSGRLYQYDDQGRPVPYGQAAQPMQGPPKAPTEAESKNAGFFQRMQLGEKNIGKFFADNPDYLDTWTARLDQFAREVGDNLWKAGGGIGAVAGGLIGMPGGPAGMAAGAGVGGGIGGGVGAAFGPTIQRWLTSEAGKRFQASAAPFVNSALRKDTGAAITSEEWRYAFTEWLPMPGDSPEVVNLKAQNRQAAMGGYQSGGGY